MNIPPFLFERTERWLSNNSQATKSAIREGCGELLKGRVLDIGCGIGGFAPLAEGEYLGADLDESRVRAAARRFKDDPRKRFVAEDAAKLDLPDDSFDLVLFINALHHLDGPTGLGVLGLARRVAKRMVVVVEPGIETDRLMTKLVLSLDQGRFLRPLARQAALIEEAGLVIRRQNSFYSGFCLQNIFFCEKKQNR